MLEVIVLVHGTLVALYQGNNLWPTFLFGYAGIQVIKQMHGLRLPNWVKWAIFAAYAGGLVLVFSGRLAKLYEPISIPLTEYASVLVMTLLFWGGLKIAAAIQNCHQSRNSQPSPE